MQRLTMGCQYVYILQSGVAISLYTSRHYTATLMHACMGHAADLQQRSERARKCAPERAVGAGQLRLVRALDIHAPYE